MKTLFELEPQDCRYVTDGAPGALFCGRPKRTGSSYCPAHHKACHAGFGKEWQALAGMMATVEQTIKPTSMFERERPSTDGVDVELREHGG
jgi:hypothetical protein